jgi:hypothetical protein
VLGDAARLVLAADHEAGDVLQEQQRDRALSHSSTKWAPLRRGLAEQHAVVGDDPDGVPVHVREAGDEGGAVLRLELVKRLPSTSRPMTSRTSYGVRASAGRPRQLGGVEHRLLDRRAVPRPRRARAERADDPPDDRQGVRVVVGEVVGDAGGARVQRPPPSSSA